jgi:hypothetical protein
MHEHRRSGDHHHLGFLLLIPAAVIIAKGAKHRRAMWESGWGSPAFADQRAGHASHVGGPAADDRIGPRLPPKIEWMLDSWHTRAHRRDEAADAPLDAPEAATI